MKIVSERLNSRAMVCICSSVMALPTGTWTKPRGLPLYRSWVKTSSVTNGSTGILGWSLEDLALCLMVISMRLIVLMLGGVLHAVVQCHALGLPTQLLDTV